MKKALHTILTLAFFTAFAMGCTPSVPAAVENTPTVVTPEEITSQESTPVATAPQETATAAQPASEETSSDGRTPLVVFGAGSLIQPFNQLADAFEAKYPQIDVQAQYHGSIQVIRHATEIHLPIDIVASADDALMQPLMLDRNDEETGLPYATWYMRFATNRLALAYTDQSVYGDEINADNMWDILSRPDVRVGIADPRFDAVGYRALIVTQLAETVTGNPTLFDNFYNGQFKYSLSVTDAPYGFTIRVPEIMETKADAHLVLRGASLQLLSLLESGDIDYTFEYESVIHQHGLNMVTLPDSLNLGNKDLDADYGTVRVAMDFQRFASVYPEFRGETIGYGITIPSNAPHPKEAELFMAFLLGPEGREIMKQNDQPLFDPVIGIPYGAVPSSLQPLCAAEQ